VVAQQDHAAVWLVEREDRVDDVALEREALEGRAHALLCLGARGALLAHGPPCGPPARGARGGAAHAREPGPPPAARARVARAAACAATSPASRRRPRARRRAGRGRWSARSARARAGSRRTAKECRRPWEASPV